MGSCTALIVAAGRGERFGSELPKQYMHLAGRPVLRHTIEAFLRHPQIDRVQAVIHPDHASLYAAATAGLGLPVPVTGGAERQDSVLAGLEALGADAPPDYVLIHDAARPLVDASTISRVIEALAGSPAALAANPVTDTLKRSREGAVESTVDRTNLWRARTPQGFRFPDILAAHRGARGHRLTDDAAVAEQAGLRVQLVASNPDNIKVTMPEDLARAECILMARLGDVRMATGFDVHRFMAGDGVTLAGIRIPHDAALEGHSDADVALHALTDAVLGAIGAGDIGQHFPPTEARWKGASSDQFLRHAVSLLRDRGGVLAHLDLTVICERPKVGPHREAMRRSIAEIAGVDPERISVKATTTEGLGFTGRREGIAAQAAATVRLPFPSP
jgi:2-C-methyl-D-erythritol 4-phosphate cytidylyltransferase/2-C-methyl-D-erythritol 2,4-cyclodiphosphate synthase